MPEEGFSLDRARSFAAEPVASRNARYFVLEWLEAHGRPDYGERAALAVSELAANAVLHTAQPFTVALRWRDDAVVVELADSAPELMAVPVPTTGSAVDITALSETGRGLQIVGSLANRWGVVLDPSIKRIWAEFGPTPPAKPTAPEVLDRRPPSPEAPGVQRITMLGLPVRLAIASGLDVEDASRDIQWIPPDQRTAADEKLLDLIDRSAPLRLAGRHAAMRAASENRLEFDVEIAATDDVLFAVAALSEELSRRAKVPGRPGPAKEVRAFRRWMMDETLRQRAGAPPTPYGVSRPVDAIDWLWAADPFGYAAVDEGGCIVFANAALTDWIGAGRLDGTAFAELLVPDDLASLEGFVDDARVGGRAEAALVFRRNDSPTPAEVRAVNDHDVLRIVVDARTAGNAAAAAALAAAEGRAAHSAARTAELISALQQTLIPPKTPSVPGLDVAAAYLPAHGEVGGDFYDVFEVAGDDWCFVLGDVSGKGVDAAILTAAARHAVRSSALREPVPSGLLHALNAALMEQASTRFCTAVLARLQRNPGSWVATLTTGGHPFPLLVRHGVATKLGRAGSLLGVFEDVSFGDVSIRLESSDALVLFTDGVTEARNTAGEMFGDERLHEAVVSAPPSAQGIVDAVVERVMAYRSAGSSDDIAVLVIRRSA